MDVKEKFITIIEKFIALAAVRLSDDVMSRLKQLRETEDSPLQQAVYDNYFENLKMARELKSPCCQDTGLLQFFIKAGTAFPRLDITAEAVTEAVKRAAESVPLRPNAVDFFSRINAGGNTGERCPWIHWEIIPASSEMEITVYFSGAGCSLPGQAKVFTPSQGMDAVIRFVLDIISGPAVNACPPLLAGIGLSNNIENAAVLSKKACLRLLGTRHPHPDGAALEMRVTEGLNSLGMGAQGLRGKNAVLGVHIESSSRHTAAIACAVNVSCYMLRRAAIKLKSDLSYELPAFHGVTL